MKHNVGNILKAAAFLILSFHTAFYAQEPLNKQSVMAKLFGMLGQSKPVHWFNMQVSAKLLSKQQKQRQHLLDLLASEQYQKLGKEAQNTLGISERQHVPIKIIGAGSSLGNNVLAIAEPDGIYVNEGVLNGYSHGFCRSVLFQ